MDTVQIFPWVQVSLLDNLARTFRLLLEELWNWYPVVNVFITILVLLMPIGGLYTITSVQGAFPEPPQACLTAPPSATTHRCQNKGTVVPVWLQQAYAYLLCFRCCLLLTLRGRGFISPDFSFLKIWLLTSFYKERRQRGISRWRFSPSSEMNPTVPDSFLVEAEG